jgi:tRNA threonylcarbamoyladenosine dehydratase
MADLSWLSRTTLLTGDEGLAKLQAAHVLVIGLGGVGSFVAEFLARSGVGELTIVDGDVVDPTNRNRQLPALATTHGMSKADLMAERLLAINPDLKLNVVKDFLTPEKATQICSSAAFSYVVDAIDSLTPKLYLIVAARRLGLPLVSSMGAGGRVDPTRIKIADLRDTKICHLALQVRKRLKRHEIRTGFKCVFSDEPHQLDSLIMTDGSNFKKSAYGTISYLPAAFGGVVSSVVLRDLLGYKIELFKEKIVKKKKTKTAKGEKK